MSYEVGTCFFCEKCMYCGKYLKVATCNCDKSIKPSKKNRTQKVKCYRNCSYIPNSNDIYAQKARESVTKFGYINVDLNKFFNYSLCSQCNSKTYREKKKFQNNSEQESSTADSIPSSTTNSLPTTPSIVFDDSPIPETEDLLLDPNPSFLNSSITTSSSSDASDSTFTSLQPFKFKLQIKSIDDTSSQPSSLIVIEKTPSNISNFKEKIQDCIDEKYGFMNYGKFKMIYKTENSHGAGNWLDNEHEFNEFLNYCDRLKKAKKLMLVIVNIQSKRKVSL